MFHGKLGWGAGAGFCVGDFAKLGEKDASSDISLHAKAGSEEPFEIEESSGANRPGVGVVFGDVCDGGGWSVSLKGV